MDAAKTGAQTGVATLLAMCTALLRRNVKGGLIVVGELNLGGSVETIHNAVSIIELAVEKGATRVLLPISARKQTIDLSDDMAMKVDLQFYASAADALVKGMA